MRFNFAWRVYGFCAVYPADREDVRNPVYAWQVAFRGEKYIGIIHSDSYLPLLPGDTVVKVEPSFDMVLKAKNAIDDIRRSANDEVILYEMSKQNVKRIKEYGYEKVFWSPRDDAGTDKH